MKIRWEMMFILVVLALFITDIANSQNITLENEKVKMITDGKHISSLYDKVRNLEHISPDFISANGIFGATYLNASTLGDPVVINANILKVSVLNSSETHADFSLENNTVKAFVGVSLGASDAEFSWTINVELKNSGYLLSQVDFPRFRTPQQYNDTVKQFLEPCVEGHTRLLSQAIQYWRVYPGSQTVQIGIVTFPIAGFSMWCDDTQGNAKSFGYLTGNGSANFAVRHFLPLNYSNWNATYATKITLHGKDWQDGAEVYRNWASKQFWCATKLKDRKDVSTLLHSPPLVISTQVDKENLNTLVSTLKDWATKFECPVIYRPLGWEKYGNWVGSDYFPTKIGDEQFVKINADLKDAGITVAGFPEPYHWVKGLTNESTQVNNALSDYYETNNGSDLCRTQIDGKVWEQTNQTRLTSFLCRGTDFGKSYFQSLSNKLFDMGVTHIHNDADHMIGLGGPCYNPAHGHTIAYGNWEAQTMNSVFSEIKAEAVRRGNKDFILSRENGSEIQNMILTGYQTRNFHIISSRKNILPLFLYIYHNYIPAIFGLVTANAKRNTQLAALIVYGQVPSIAFWNTYASSPTTSITDQISVDVLKDYYDVMKTHGKDFLLYGSLLKPAVQSAPGALHNTWQDDAGNIGIFAVDTLDFPTTIKVKIPGAGIKYMNVYNGKTLVSSSQVQGAETYSWILSKWRLSSLIFSDSPLTSIKSFKEKAFNPIFPNPVTDILNISMKDIDNEWEVEIFDMAGKSLMKQMNNYQLAINQLEKGLYFVHVRTFGQNFVEKIVKILIESAENTTNI